MRHANGTDFRHVHQLNDRMMKYVYRHTVSVKSLDPSGKSNRRPRHQAYNEDKDKKNKQRSHPVFVYKEKIYHKSYNAYRQANGAEQNTGSAAPHESVKYRANDIIRYIMQICTHPKEPHVERQPHAHHHPQQRSEEKQCLAAFVYHQLVNEITGEISLKNKQQKPKVQIPGKNISSSSALAKYRVKAGSPEHIGQKHPLYLLLEERNKLRIPPPVRIRQNKKPLISTNIGMWNKFIHTAVCCQKGTVSQHHLDQMP